MLRYMLDTDIKGYIRLRTDAGRPVSFKTVNNWLRAGRLPGARKDDRGVWRIPVDAEPTAAAELATIPPATPAPAVTVAGVLETMPAYLDVPTAARLLGISEHAVRTRRERYRLEPVGERGRLMVPQAVVREVLGA